MTTAESNSEELRAHVEDLLDRAGIEAVRRADVGREWLEHLNDSYEEARSSGRSGEEALAESCRRFGSGRVLRARRDQLEWLHDIRRSAFGAPMAVWMWVAFETAVLPIWWSALGPQVERRPAEWALTLLCVAGLLSGLVFVQRFTAARLDRGGLFPHALVRGFAGMLATWPLIAGLHRCVYSQHGAWADSAGDWLASAVQALPFTVALVLATLAVTGLRRDGPGLNARHYQTT